MKKAILLCRSKTSASKNLLSVQEENLKKLAKTNDFAVVDSIRFIGSDFQYKKKLKEIVRRILKKEADLVLLENPQCISNDPEEIADFLLAIKSSGGKTVFRKYCPIWR